MKYKILHSNSQYTIDNQISMTDGKSKGKVKK